MLKRKNNGPIECLRIYEDMIIADYSYQWKMIKLYTN